MGRGGDITTLQAEGRAVAQVSMEASLAPQVLALLSAWVLFVEL